MANAGQQKTSTRSANKSASTTKSKRTATTAAAVEEKPIVAKEIDPNQYVIVRNGFQGTLVYKSQRTGELFVWEEFGAEQEMELRELRNARNSNKAFFENNWFMFDEDYDWVIDYLGVRQYYRNAVSIDHFDDIFTKSADELKELISGMSDGQKMSVAYRARTLIAENKIDSRSVIETLETALGLALIEH